MKVKVTSTGKTLGHASAQLIANNIECYENTVPNMLSDRLRNPKFAGPENAQTGIAAEWEPIGNNMGSFHARLIPGMYLSGQESQMIHTYSDYMEGGILQTGVTIFEGEELEVEMWARARRRPSTVTVSLTGKGGWNFGDVKMEVTEAHWHRVTARITVSHSCDDAYFTIRLSPDSMVYIDQIHLRPVGEPNVAKALTESFDHFPCPVLRFPGGCATCTYHWEHSIGPVHLRPVQDDPVFKYKMAYEFGTDEFLELCAEKNIRPFITLNSSTATPESGAAWAAYIREWYQKRNLPIPSAYFMIGNENYGTHEIGHMTGEMYVSQIRAFTPLLREAYPEARIFVIGEMESHAIRKGGNTPWRELVLKESALFDGIIVTSYCGCSDSLTMDKTMESVAENVATKQKHLDAMAQSIRDAGADCTMGLAEWNFWTRASHNDHEGFYEPCDIRHCLFSAGHINHFCRLGDIMEVSCFYALINTMGMVQIHNGRYELLDLVKVFNLYQDALPGETLDVTVDAPAFTENMKMLDANFVRKGDVTYGFLVNFSSTESMEISLEGLGTIREATGLHADAILQPVETIDVKVSGACVTVPPISLVRVIL